MYLANYTRSDIAFAVNLLARYNFSPTRRYWNGVKQILCYLKGTINMNLFYPNDSKIDLMSYADAYYLSYPHNGRSQIGYFFTCGDTTISWWSVKQTITTTSSNHAEILALHEGSHECVWLRSIIQHVQQTCDLSSKKMKQTTIYEDNIACIAQLKEWDIKGDKTKHILPKFFFTHDLQKNGDVEIQKIHSCENVAHLFTKSLPNRTFEQLVHKIGLRHLDEVSLHEGKK